MFGIDLESFIKAIGIFGVFVVVFAESGVLLGLFLPGDSLLFTVGLLASQGYADVRLLMAVTFLAAVLGDSVGYAFGKKVGPKVFVKEDSLFFRKAYLLRAQEFYFRHGGKTIILARFMPVVRTLAPVLAGVGEMKYRTFLFYNVLGAILWAVGITGFGFWLGNIIPDPDRYIFPAIVFIIITSFMPPVLRLLKDKEGRAYLKDLLRKINLKLVAMVL